MITEVFLSYATTFIFGVIGGLMIAYAITWIVVERKKRRQQ